MKVSRRRTVLGGLVGLLAVPGVASAAATTTIAQTTVAPGCQPKGLTAQPGAAAGATLATGTYTYIVVAAGAPPCTTATVPVNNAGAPATNLALVQWNATPGATSYKVYRTTNSDVPGTLLATVPSSAACPPGGAGPRCVFQDTGGAAAGAGTESNPSFLGGLTAAGMNADLLIVQRFDYGGDPASSSDDPTTANDALKTNLLHFPPGLLANPTASATKCNLSGPAPSLLGSLTLFGSNDPAEDTCPRSSQVGTINALIRTGSAPSGAPTPGDVYLGTPLGSETARLFVVLRPSCSSGSFVAPGSPTCTTILGSANLEVDKSFLSAKATIRSSGPVVDYGIDNETTSVVSGADGPLSSTSTIRQRSASPGTPNQVAGTTPIQVRSLTQTLFGLADQGTASTADDKGSSSCPPRARRRR